MQFWMSTNFQNSVNEWMNDIEWFHTYCIFLLLPIIFLVFFVILFLFYKNNFFFPLIWEHPTLEGAWTFIPAQFLFILAVPSIELLYMSENSLNNTPDLTVKVMGHQWYWSYEYSDWEDSEFDSYMIPSEDLMMGEFRVLEVDNRLWLPIFSFIRFIVSSTDVLHSWALPSAGLKVDAVPGRLNQMISNFNSPGIFYGQCSEICGANHSFMPIMVEIN